MNSSTSSRVRVRVRVGVGVRVRVRGTDELLHVLACVCEGLVYCVEACIADSLTLQVPGWVSGSVRLGLGLGFRVVVRPRSVLVAAKLDLVHRHRRVTEG